jgi:hypothetical protein
MNPTASFRRSSCALRLAGLTAVLIAGLATTAHAQLGSGWSQTTFTKKIHLDDENGLQTFNYTTDKSVGSGTPCARYHYLSSNDSEYFDIFDNRSNRSEIRLQNEYSTGSKQFQGYVRINSPLNDESLFQIFGSTSGATQMMIRGYSSSGGSIRTVGTPSGVTLATNCYGVEQRINVIHLQGNKIEVYCNGSLKGSGSDTESVTNYWKYGCYGTLTTGAVQVRWRQVRTYQK